MLLDDETRKETGTSAALSERTGEDEILRCRRCGHAVARARDRTEVEGRHIHVFVNPSAFEYRIGCFREAEGCVPVGETSTFWSWFRGYAWTIAVCAGCSGHVGWSFTREGASGFHGLILDRLAT